MISESLLMPYLSISAGRLFMISLHMNGSTRLVADSYSGRSWSITEYVSARHPAHADDRDPDCYT